jgi:hypothetical protein
VLIRQAHPGPAVPAYRDFAQKWDEAERFQREETIPYSVLVDDVAGTVHQTYGGLADPTYIIDIEGRVAYYNMWTHAPTLDQGLQELFAQGGRGVVMGEGVDRTPHILPALTEGWNGLRKGLPQSLTDMELAVPGTGVGSWLAHQFRPILAPFTLRAKPVPAPVRALLWLGVAGLAVGAVQAAKNRRK